MSRYRWPPGIHRIPDKLDHLHTHLHRMEHALMATQADVDAIATELSDATTVLAAGVGELVTGIQNLEDQIAALPAGSDIDVTDLKATADRVKDAADNLKGIADSVPQATPPADPPPAG